MPVKWTPENDQLLLLKILETHELSVNSKLVADAWPNTEENGKKADRPTPRAITERLVRMRQMVKATSSGTGNTDGHFSIGKGTGSGPSTPRKPRGAAGSGLKTPSSSNKRKRSGLSDAAKADEEDGTPTQKKPLNPTTAGMNQNQNHENTLEMVGVTLKLEDDDEKGFLDPGSPSKRVRRPSTFTCGMVSYNDDDVEDEDEDEDVESSASEYTPDQAREENEDLYA